ncbi:MAG: bacterioferritin [Cardiobacteriaceae bacterium]|nr:bacterioferritin [Cardiobacteriaceae bacterium]
MKADSAIILELNLLLKFELTLINQYFLHARIFNHFGYKNLYHRVYKQSIKAMKNADTLSERILFLEGLPNLQDLGRLNIGENPQEMLACDLHAAKTYHSEQAVVAGKLAELEDFVSQELVKAQIACNEEYIDWLEEQENLIQEIGLEKFLQRHLEKE